MDTGTENPRIQQLEDSVERLGERLTAQQNTYDKVWTSLIDNAEKSAQRTHRTVQYAMWLIGGIAAIGAASGLWGGISPKIHEET